MSTSLFSHHILSRQDKKAVEGAGRARRTTTSVPHTGMQLSLSIIGARNSGKSTLAALFGGYPFVKFPPSDRSSIIVTWYSPGGAAVTVKLIINDVHYEDPCVILTDGVVFTVNCMNPLDSFNFIELVIPELLPQQQVLFALTKTQESPSDNMQSVFTRLTPIVSNLRIRKIACQIIPLDLAEPISIVPLQGFLKQVYASMRCNVARRELQNLEKGFLQQRTDNLSYNSKAVSSLIVSRNMSQTLSIETLTALFNMNDYDNRNYSKQLEIFNELMAVKTTQKPRGQAEEPVPLQPTQPDHKAIITLQDPLELPPHDSGRAQQADRVEDVIQAYDEIDANDLMALREALNAGASVPASQPKDCSFGSEHQNPPGEEARPAENAAQPHSDTTDTAPANHDAAAHFASQDNDLDGIAPVDQWPDGKHTVSADEAAARNDHADCNNNLETRNILETPAEDAALNNPNHDSRIEVSPDCNGSPKD